MTIHEKVSFSLKEKPEKQYYVLKEDLFNWFIELNITLVTTKQFRIKNDHLDSMFKSFFQNDSIIHCPREIKAFGHRFGLIGYDYDDSYYFFPLVRLVLLNESLFEIAIKIFKEINIHDFTSNNLDEIIITLVHFGFSLHEKGTANKVKIEEGLFTEEKTNHDSTKKDNFSPETEIEIIKFYEQIHRDPQKYLWPFLKALFFLVMSRSGSFIQYLNGKDDNLFKFLCKCCRMNFIEISNIEVIILSSNIPKINSIFLKKNLFRIDFSQVVADIKSMFAQNFTFEDIVDISKKVQNYRLLKVQHTKKFLQRQIESIITIFNNKSKKPVSLNTIVAELVKYRDDINIKLVKQCIRTDPKIEKRSKDNFILLDEKEINESKLKTDKSDKAFLNFFNKSVLQEQIIPEEHFHKAIIKCEICDKMESFLLYKAKLLQLRCISCNHVRNYPAGVWGVFTNIPCPECKNDFIIGFHPKYGPYLKCKKCGFWDKVFKYLKQIN